MRCELDNATRSLQWKLSAKEVGEMTGCGEGNGLSGLIHLARKRVGSDGDRQQRERRGADGELHGSHSDSFMRWLVPGAKEGVGGRRGGRGGLYTL